MSKCQKCKRKKLKKKLKVGVLLVGGSLKGIYGHTGVMSAIKEFDCQGLEVKVILGASAGSVIGAFYAANLSTYSIYKKMLSLRAKDFIDLLPKIEFFYRLIICKGRHFFGFIRGKMLGKYMEKQLEGKNDFDKMTTPLYISGVNLDTYKLVLFNTGVISDKVRASTAVPILFQPQKIDGSNYIDGAIKRIKLPYMLLKRHPELDVIIISNFIHEATQVESNYLENTTLPLLEITRRILSMQETTEWPTKIGKTKIVNIYPKGLRSVDFFNPSREAAREIFRGSKTFAINKIKKAFKL